MSETALELDKDKTVLKNYNLSKMCKLNLSDWRKLQNNVIEGTVLRLSKTAQNLFNSADTISISDFFYNFVHSFVSQNVNCHPIQFFSLTFAKNKWPTEIQFVLSQILNAVWIECRNSDQKNSKTIELRFLALLSGLLSTQLISSDVFEKTLSVELIGKLGILDTAKHLNFV
ncbi:hypothetical protein MHBO_002430 [Bonamia ostreae]|uniref:Uncharacterized protein n=1 Tax=Bonamia ostreae TaxID=126728 RepID=A0ABV2AMD5_9EUKA